MATNSITGVNSAAFTTTAATEAVVGIAYIPTEVIASAAINIDVAFTAINAATTALTVKCRQASFSAGALVVTTPTGAQVGANGAWTGTAGTVSTAQVSITAVDLVPLALTAPATIPAQAQSLGMPGAVPAGGFLYVVTVTSTTNVATVAAQAASIQVLW